MAEVNVRVSEEYILAAKDTSLETFSRPQWALYLRSTVACTAILVGAVALMLHPRVSDEARMIALTLGPAAGFRLIETGAVPSPSKKGK